VQAIVVNETPLQVASLPSVKRPILSDLHEVGDIEPHIDAVLFAYRGVHYNRDTSEPDVLELILARPRSNDLAGTIKLAVGSNGALANRPRPSNEG